MLKLKKKIKKIDPIDLMEAINWKHNEIKIMPYREIIQSCVHYLVIKIKFVLENYTVHFNSFVI